MFAKAVNPLFTRVFGFFSFCAAFNAITENLLVGLYKKKYDALVRRFEKAKQRLQEIHDTKRDREARRLQTDHFMRELKKQECIITEFDEVLWYTLVDRITVYNETDIRFTFKDGTEYKV